MGQGTDNWAGYGNHLNGNGNGVGATCNDVTTGGPNSKSFNAGGCKK